VVAQLTGSLLPDVQGFRLCIIIITYRRHMPTAMLELHCTLLTQPNLGPNRSHTNEYMVSLFSPAVELGRSELERLRINTNVR